MSEYWSNSGDEAVSLGEGNYQETADETEVTILPVASGMHGSAVASAPQKPPRMPQTLTNIFIYGYSYICNCSTIISCSIMGII
jgi:hypothetical protein